jgi:UDP:flavonoid glycosyltransferase YjiC (YdhE family)
LTLPAGRYSAGRAQAALARLLEDPSFAERGGKIRAAMAEERGAATAASAILRAFG